MSERTAMFGPGAAIRGLDRQVLPMRLWEKGKAHGAWDPAAIDFSVDRAQWSTLPDSLRRRIVQLCAIFCAGEEAVSGNLLPFARVVAAEGRREEEIYLTSFLWDEARHVDLFHRLVAELGIGHDAWPSPEPIYGRIFDEELRPVLARLWIDASPVAQVRASVTYNLFVEGVMAETGYYVFRTILGSARLPGLQQAMTLLQRDESRHIAYGLYVLSRLIVEHHETAYKAFLERINELGPLVALATDALARTLDGVSTRLTARELARVTQHTFVARVQRVAAARTQTCAQLEAIGMFDQDERALAHDQRSLAAAAVETS